MESKDNIDQFKSMEEFVDNIQRGGEVEFYYKQNRYSLTRQNRRIYLTQIGSGEDDIEFDDVEQLLSYEIDNYKFYDIVTKIEPYFRCF